ncbi:MAG TPA: response regulator transcription factor [bacterium]|jgi:DNA-binding NarL/FixJ family response regulator|nr:response regulator transcription factor [bacterium]
MDPVRVLIVADDAIARAGLAALLGEQPDCVVAGQIGGDADLAEAFEAAQADVILLDPGWNGERSLEQLAEAREWNLPVALLLAGPHEAGPALAAGAHGLLLRTTESAPLAAALAAVAAGLTVLDPVLSAETLPGREPAADHPVEDLTPREHEVLQLLADGLPNRAIAERLAISEHTVKFHVNAIMGKLGARTRTEAVTRAARLGLLIL